MNQMEGGYDFVVFYGETMRSMKSPWAILSARRRYTFILSVSIHVLIFSIPVSMGIKPQIHDMELFVSIEDLRIPPGSVKGQMGTKKLQPEPVKEISKPIETPRLKTRKLETSEPIREVKAEPVKEIKVEPIETETNSQPTTETREAFFVPAMPSGTQGGSNVFTGERSIGMASNIGKQPPGSQNAIGGGAGNLIETRFGAFVAPAFLHKEMPIYPMMARKLGREGMVILKLTIDEKGNLSDVEVIKKADYGFTEAAVEAVKKSTFLPAKKDGKPIASRALLPIRFKLERDGW
jgi:protein TonB